MAMIWLTAAAFLAVFLAPADAWAWGPITHLVHGSEVLENLTILGASLQRLLRRHRLEYLYGCIGADITQAKKYTRAQQAHCHSWPVGWALLQRAAGDGQRAFAWGYLTHLTGDVYSHNHFVPTQLIVSFHARTLRHIYWEARFDSMQQRAHRDLIGELRDHRFPECDALVKEVVARTLFSFGTDKRIFDGFIAVHDIGQWHRILRRLSARSRYALPLPVVQRYNAVCHANVMDVLQHGAQAGCQHADPTGQEMLTRAKRVRKMLKALERGGRLSPKLLLEIAALDARQEIAVPPAIATLPLAAAH